MRIVILAATAAAFIVAFRAGTADAARYCLKQGPGPGDCKYSSYRQCQASASGVGGTCQPSPFRRRR